MLLSQIWSGRETLHESGSKERAALKLPFPTSLTRDDARFGRRKCYLYFSIFIFIILGAVEFFILVSFSNSLTLSFNCKYSSVSNTSLCNKISYKSIVIFFLWCNSCDSFYFDDLQHISCIFSRCKRSVRSPYGTPYNLRTECPALLITLTWRCGYAAVFSSPFICLIAFFTFHPFSYKAIINLLPFSVQTVYEFVPVEPSERVKVLVRVSCSFHAE